MFILYIKSVSFFLMNIKWTSEKRASCLFFIPLSDEHTCWKTWLLKVRYKMSSKWIFLSQKPKLIHHNLWSIRGDSMILSFHWTSLDNFKHYIYLTEECTKRKWKSVIHYIPMLHMFYLYYLFFVFLWCPFTIALVARDDFFVFFF